VRIRLEAIRTYARALVRVRGTDVFNTIDLDGAARAKLRRLAADGSRLYVPATDPVIIHSAICRRVRSPMC
jgi:hypothetical protein